MLMAQLANKVSGKGGWYPGRRSDGCVVCCCLCYCVVKPSSALSIGSFSFRNSCRFSVQGKSAKYDRLVFQLQQLTDAPAI
jgi:hypothetical protein